MPTSFAGGCACNAIRYHCTAAPLAMYNCHCRVCQRISGNAFCALLVVNANDVHITGTPRYHTIETDMCDHAHVGFCATCGSSLFARPAAQPALLIITAGSVDNCSWYKAIADIWTVNAQPWATMNRRIPKMFKSPPMLVKSDAVQM